MSQKTLDHEELTIFLNQQSATIEIDYPLTSEQIATFTAEDKGYQVEVHIDDAPAGFSDSELWDHEKPSYNDYIQCFLASDLIPYKNHEQILMEIHSYQLPRAKILFAPDTNLFYNRFPGNNVIAPGDLLIVDSVHKEINRMLNKKYNPRQLAEIKRTVRYQKHILDEFINRRMKQSRKAYNLALQEYLSVVNRAFHVIQTDDLRQDKELNDALFCEAVAEYKSMNNGTYPIVLTADRLFPDLCKSHGLPSIFFELPTTINVEYSTPRKLRDLICNLAGVLGVVKVNKTLVYGEYREKQGIDKYKLDYLSGETPLVLERELEICRALRKLNINF